MKNIRIGLMGTPHDYQSSLLPVVITTLGYKINWVSPKDADLIIMGPFSESTRKPYGWCPKPLRPLANSIHSSIKQAIKSRRYEPITIFHTQENIRHDQIPADYSISFDLGVESTTHFRLPYWMEMIDWGHEGITGNSNPRYGELLSISNLMRPLGNQFLERGGSCVLLSSHLREPRNTLYRAIEKVVPVTGYGAYFDKSIKNHHTSNFFKKDILEKFSFNLCPENGLYPGYYTEKIPEAFNAGCLPITWTDENVSADFNPNAFINLLPHFKNNFNELDKFLTNTNNLKDHSSEALLLKQPYINPFVLFLKEILQSIA